MRIREATRADMPAIERMALAFLGSTAYGKLFHATPASLAVLASLLFNFGDRAAILLAEDDTEVFGMLAIVAAPHPVSGEIYGDEVVWWIDPSRRGFMAAGPALLRAGEEWARSRNCYMIKMVAPYHASGVSRFLERSGYTPIETAHAKVL